MLFRCAVEESLLYQDVDVPLHGGSHGEADGIADFFNGWSEARMLPVVVDGGKDFELRVAVRFSHVCFTVIKHSAFTKWLSP